MKKLILSVLIFSSLCSCAQTKKQYDAILKNFRAYYNQHQYDSSYNLLAPALKSSLTPDIWKNTLLTQVEPTVGTLSPFVFDRMSLGLPQYIAYGEKSTFGLQISIDVNGLLNGIHMIASKSSADSIRSQTEVPP